MIKLILIMAKLKLEDPELYAKLKQLIDNEIAARKLTRCGYCGELYTPEGWYCPHCGGC